MKSCPRFPFRKTHMPNSIERQKKDQINSEKNVCPFAETISKYPFSGHHLELIDHQFKLDIKLKGISFPFHPNKM
jgi:hypothetical protein